jgi:DNA-binding transcriptional MerR regulator
MPLPQPQRRNLAENTSPAEGRDAASRRHEKSASAFRTISEVATELDVPQHVLRFWETKFSQVRPLKRGGGRRYYRPEDVELLRAIRKLLYEEGYTIKGVQRLMREGVFRIRAQEMAAAEAADAPELPLSDADVAAETDIVSAASEDRGEPVGTESADPETHRRELIENAIEELTELRNRLARLLG